METALSVPHLSVKQQRIEVLYQSLLQVPPLYLAYRTREII